jgi:hypothetical protein
VNTGVYTPNLTHFHENVSFHFLHHLQLSIDSQSKETSVVVTCLCVFTIMYGTSSWQVESGE